MADKWLNQTQAAEFLGVSRMRIHKLAEEGRLKVKTGPTGKRVYSQNALAEYREKHADPERRMRFESRTDPKIGAKRMAEISAADPKPAAADQAATARPAPARPAAPQAAPAAAQSAPNLATIKTHLEYEKLLKLRRENQVEAGKLVAVEIVEKAGTNIGARIKSKFMGFAPDWMARMSEEDRDSLRSDIIKLLTETCADINKESGSSLDPFPEAS